MASRPCITAWDSCAEIDYDLLSDAAISDDQRVQFLYPEWPVLCKFRSNNEGFCRLEKAAPKGQVRSSLQEMGLGSGTIGRLNGMSLRYGGTRNVAHLLDILEGYLTNTVRQLLGHSSISFCSGMTEGYVGEPDRHIWNDR